MRAAALALLFAGSLPGQQDARGAAEEVPLELEVNHTIVRGVQWLKEGQADDGSWPAHSDQHGNGMTALAAYTLLRSGVRPDDEALVGALRVLDQGPPPSTYGRACYLLMAEASRQPDRWRTHCETAVAALAETQQQGLWAYPWAHVDMSNVQFALLGLHAAYRMGIAIPEELLADCAEAIFGLQHEDGGFRYRVDTPPTGGMTAATLAGLEILAVLAEEDRDLRRVLRKHRREIAAARDWLDARFRVDANPVRADRHTSSWHFPYLWAIERYGGFSGEKTIGGRDWYRAGARWLVDHQLASGDWPHQGVASSCFALLFLRRATVTPDEELEILYARIDAERADRAPRRPDRDAPRQLRWLVAGPYRCPPRAEPIDEEPFRARSTSLRDGGRAGEERWQAVTLEDRAWVDLDRVVEDPSDHCLWALGAHLTVPGERPLPVTLWLTTEDGWRAFVDGEEVGASRKAGTPILEDSLVDLELAPGGHELVIWLEDLGGAAAFGARLTDRHGQPHGSRHLRVTLDEAD